MKSDSQADYHTSALFPQYSGSQLSRYKYQW